MARVIEQQVIAACGFAEKLLDGVEHLALGAIEQTAHARRGKEPGLRVGKGSVQQRHVVGGAMEPLERVRILLEDTVADQQGLVTGIGGHEWVTLT